MISRNPFIYLMLWNVEGKILPQNEGFQDKWYEIIREN